MRNFLVDSLWISSTEFCFMYQFWISYVLVYWFFIKKNNGNHDKDSISLRGDVCIYRPVCLYVCIIFYKHSLYLFNSFTYEFFCFSKTQNQIFCHMRPCRSFLDLFIFWSKAEWPKLYRKRVQYISQTGAIQQIFFVFLFCFLFCVFIFWS